MTNCPTDLALKRSNWPVTDQIAWDDSLPKETFLTVRALASAGQKEAEGNASRLMATGSAFSAGLDRSACRPT
jgi:hypothetical protein